MKAKWIAICAFVVAALSALALSGCSSEPSYDIVLGDKDAAASQLVVTNSTEKEITSVKVAVTGSEDSDEYLAEGETWEAEKAALLCVPEVDATDEAVNEDRDGEDAIELKTTFDITFTADDKEYTLHQVSVEGLSEVKDAAVYISDSGLAYLSYTEDGEEVSTFEAENAIKEQAEAEAKAAEEAAKAEAEAKAQAEAEAKAAEEAAAAAAQQDTSSSYSSSSNSGSSYSGSGSSNSGSNSAGSSSASSSSGVSQDEDMCIGPDEIQFRD